MLAAPLVHAGPPPFRDADGVVHQRSEFYKDEGGKNHCLTLDVCLSRREQEVSVGCVRECQNTKRGEQGRCRRSIATPAQNNLVPSTLFQLIQCETVSTYEDDSPNTEPVPDPHLLNPDAGGTGAWKTWQNVQTFCASPRCKLVRLRCKFKRCTASLRCECGGSTMFRIVVHTDQKRTATTIPIVVKSKRKIPAKMRTLSEKEIQAYKKRCRAASKTTLTSVGMLTVRVPPATGRAESGLNTSRRARKPPQRAKKRAKTVRTVHRASNTDLQIPPTDGSAPACGLLTENKMLLAQLEASEARVQQLSSENTVLVNYMRAQLEAYRSNYEVILQNMYDLTDAHNEHVTHTNALQWSAKGFEDNILEDVGGWDLPDTLPELTESDMNNLW